MPTINPYQIRPKANPNDPMAQLTGIVAQGKQQGYLDPQGSPQLMRGLERQAVQGQADQTHRGDTLSRLVGFNPSQQQSYLADLGRQQGSQTSGFLNQAHLGQLQGGQDWIRQLFGGQVDFKRQQMLAQLQAKLQKQNQGSGLGHFLGTAAGAGIGFLAGGPAGAGLGAGIGGNAFGGGGGGQIQFDPYQLYQRQQQQPYNQELRA